MQVKFSWCQGSIHIALSPRAYKEAVERWGKLGELVMTWQQFKALALGVKDDAEGPEKHEKLREGVRFFAQRQGLNPADF